MAYPANPQAFEASRKRDIKDGREYEKYFPLPENGKGTIKRDGSVKDTVKIMGDIVLHTLDDTKAIAQILKGNTLEDTCSNIWGFCYHYIQYKLDDPGKEQLRRPARSFMTDRTTGIDCDCYSIFVSSILTNLNIPHSFRVTKYNAGWQHVYVIVPTGGRSYITIDPVLDSFNHEKQFTDKMDYNMENHKLSGVPIEYLSGLGIGETDQDLLDVLTGSAFAELDKQELLGETPSGNQVLDALKTYIVQTRDAIKKNPQSVMLEVGNTKEYVKMLDYAIANWDDPEARDKALDLLEENEEKLLSIVKGEETTLGKKGKGKVKGFFTKVKDTVKTVKGKAKDTVKKVKEKAKEDIKKAVKAVKKYNPISVSARNGLRLAIQLNLFGLASKAKKDPKAYEALKKIFVKDLAGKEENMKKSIDRGSSKKELLGETGSLTGNEELLGDPVTLTAILTAAVPIASAVSAMKRAGVSGTFLGEGEEDKLTEQSNLVQELIKKIKSIFSKKKNEPAINDPDVKIPDSEKEDQPEGEDKSEDDDEPEESKSGSILEKTGDFIKANPKTSAGIGVGAVVLTYGIYKWVTSSDEKERKKTLTGVKKRVKSLKMS